MNIIKTTKHKLSSIFSCVETIPREYFVVALITCIVYFVSYLWFPATPGNLEQYFVGWFGWADQGSYLASTKAIANWSLSPAEYIYPLGYPFLGALFVEWLPRHPFLIPNLIFSVGIVLAFYASCRKFLTKIESFLLVIFLFFLSGWTQSKVVAGGLIWFNSLIIPWNLIPVFFAAYLTTWLLVFNVATYRKFWVASCVIALAFFSRPPDILFLGMIYLAGLVDMKTLKEKLRGLMILLVPTVFVLLIMLITKLSVFGSFLSPYDLEVKTQGFGFHDLLFKFYLTFFDGSTMYGFDEPMLLLQMPWLLLCIPGVFLLTRRTHSKFWFLICAIAICLTVYISFNPLSPSNTLNWYGFRYFVWIFPWIGLCAYLTLTRAPVLLGIRKTMLGALAGILIAVVFGWKTTIVATVYPGTEISAQQSYQHFDASSKSFTTKMRLEAPAAAGGFKLKFSTLPSTHMAVAGHWASFKMTVDGKEQSLYRDYNLYQNKTVVYATFRNPVNNTGTLQEAIFQFAETESPLLQKITLVNKKFQPFIFLKIALIHYNIAPISSYASNYIIGSDITMGAGGNARRYMLTGWSNDENGYTFTEGRNARVALKTLPERVDLILVLDAAGLSSPKRQTAKIKINGKPVKKLFLSSSRKTYHVNIPKKYLRPDGVMLIEFDLPRAISPLELGINKDKRILSMAVYNLNLHQKK